MIIKRPQKFSKKKLGNHWMGKSDLDFRSPLLPALSANQRRPEPEAIAKGKNS